MSKIPTIEEMVNLKDLKMDQLHGTLKTYVMRVGREKSEPKEVTFKVCKKAEENKYPQYCSSCESDQGLAQLARKMKHDSGKYKGKFPFKCFNYGQVHHYA